MTIIMQGATQTLEITLPSSIDLAEANIYFSIEQFEKTVLEKTGTDVFLKEAPYMFLWGRSTRFPCKKGMQRYR